MYFFFLMIRRPPRSTLDRSSAASDVYKRQEFNLLTLFMENPGYTLTRDDLLEKALGYASEGMGRALDTHIRNLRRKIESDPDNPATIQTVYGVGYRMAGGVPCTGYGSSPVR